MRWLLRFIAWATLLALPCFWLDAAYVRMLAGVSLRLLGLGGDLGRIPPPDIPPSHVLGVYAAMCLASTRAPLARRIVAVAAGLAAMVALEIATGTLAMHWAIESARAPASPALHRLRDYATSLPAWLGAPAVWLLMLGRWELPRAARGVRTSRGGPGGPASPTSR
ncbi:MAG: hypothetical protein HYR74_00595 [Candidatus Eisenbacteria bacterium]|nr:hypothetical protein [Candidatus Eisenbacteria bacterium]